MCSSDLKSQGIIAASAGNHAQGVALACKKLNISEATNGNSVLDHAEIMALKKALDKLSTNRLNEYDIYVSIEPCPMCATAIAKTHIRRLYFGAGSGRRPALPLESPRPRGRRV